MWFRRTKRDGRLTLAPVTPASYLAGRAALRLPGLADECDLSALPDAALVAFVDAVTAEGVGSYADREALDVTARAVYAAWITAVSDHHERGCERADVACEALNWFPPDRNNGDPPPPEAMPAQYGERWPETRGLPLWEVVCAGLVGAALAAKDDALKPIREATASCRRN